MQLSLSLSVCVSMKLIQVNIHSTVWKDWRVFFWLPDFQYKHGNAIERTDKVSVTLLLSAQLARDTMQMVESCTQNDCKF
jgi:hypothetical protein